MRWEQQTDTGLTYKLRAHARIHSQPPFHSKPFRIVQGKNKHMRMIKIQTLCPPRFFPRQYTVDAMTPRNNAPRILYATK